VPDDLDDHDQSGADVMARAIPLTQTTERQERSADLMVEKLREENAQLRDLVIQLTTIVVRNAIDRTRDITH
jgi:hypothetical protein